MPFDAEWSDRYRPFGIHYCGKDPHRYAASFAKLPPDLQMMIEDTTRPRIEAVGKLWDSADAPGKAYYLWAAGLACQRIDIGGPFDQSSGPTPETLRKIYVCGHTAGKHTDACARLILANFTGRAFRRPAK